MNEPDSYMDKVERIAAETAKANTTPEGVGLLHTTVTLESDDDCETSFPVAFVRDLGDTWSVHVGPGMYMAVRNPEQGVVISRLVEMLAAHRRSITFTEDGTERDHE